jgi:hypothetical protein
MGRIDAVGGAKPNIVPGISPRASAAGSSAKLGKS